MHHFALFFPGLEPEELEMLYTWLGHSLLPIRSTDDVQQLQSGDRVVAILRDDEIGYCDVLAQFRSVSEASARSSQSSSISANTPAEFICPITVREPIAFCLDRACSFHVLEQSKSR